MPTCTGQGCAFKGKRVKTNKRFAINVYKSMIFDMQEPPDHFVISMISLYSTSL